MPGIETLIISLIFTGVKALFDGALALSEKARRENRALTQAEQDAIASGNVAEIDRFNRLTGQ